MSSKSDELMVSGRKSLCSKFATIAKRLHLPSALFDFSQTAFMDIPILPLSDDSFTVRPATVNDLPLLTQCRQMDDVEQGIALFTDRINKGANCYVLFDSEDTLLGYAWVIDTVNLFEDDDRIAVSCCDDQSYIFDTFLHPSSRGKGLYKILISHLQQDEMGKGKRRFYVLVDHNNTVSIKAHQKLGSTILENITYASFFGLCRYTMKTSTDVRTSFRRYHSSVQCDSLVLHPQDMRSFSLAITAVHDESDWKGIIERLSRCDFSENNSHTPFSDPSVVKVWWETDIKDKEEFFLLEIVDPENSLTVAYGFFRLYPDPYRFGHPKKLVAFDDVYFMHTTLLTRCKGLQSSDVMKFLTSKKQVKRIQKSTKADVIIWHRLPPQEIPTLQRGRGSRWTTLFEADYPILEGDSTSGPLESDIAKHTLRDLTKQGKRLRNKFTGERETSCFAVGSLEKGQREEVLQRFFTLFSASWQNQWMKECDRVDNKVFENKLRLYTQRWADNNRLVIYINHVGDIDMSYLYTLQEGRYCWCLFIGYDQQYRTYSPGKAVLIDMFKDTWDNQVREYYLGGNVVGWKTDWFTKCPPLHTMEMWLTSPIAFFHRLKLFIRKSQKRG